MGNAYYMTNKYQESIEAYQKALNLNDKNSETHFNIASAYNDLGEVNKAIIHYKKAIELDKENLDTYFSLG